MYTPTSRLLSLTSLLLFAACGSNDSSATGGAAAATAAPTADETNAAQSSTQAASDGSDGAAAGGTSTRDAVAVSASASASTSGTTLIGKRSQCAADALTKGATLSADTTQNAPLVSALGAIKGPLSTAVSLNAAVSASVGRSVAGLPVIPIPGGSAAAAAAASSTASATLAFDPTVCTLGHSTLSGWEVLQSTGQSVQVVADISWKEASGAVIAVTTADPNYPTFEIGLETGATATQRGLDLYINEHRVRTAASGTVDIDVVTQTAPNAPTKVSESLAASATAGSSQTAVQTRTIESGTVKTTHNLAHFVATHTFTALKFDLTTGCTCPVGGTLAQTAVANDGSRNATHTYTFTGCGTATVASTVTTKASTVTASGQVTFSSCQ